MLNSNEIQKSLSMKALNPMLIRKGIYGKVLLFVMAFVYVACTPCFKFKSEKELLYSFYSNSVERISRTQLNLLQTDYISTDTCSGIEVDYYYYIDGKKSNCINLKFFTLVDSANVFNNIFELFKNTPVSIVKYNEFDILSPHFYCASDTFYYSNNHTLYMEQNFSNAISRPVYRLSGCEFVKIFRVTALVDKFSGNVAYNAIYFPCFNKNLLPIDQIWQLQYRKVFSRVNIERSNPFGLKKVTNKTIMECYMIYH